MQLHTTYRHRDELLGMKSDHTMNLTAVFQKTECNGIILTHPMPDLSTVLERNLHLKGNRNSEGVAN